MMNVLCLITTHLTPYLKYNATEWIGICLNITHVNSSQQSLMNALLETVALISILSTG
jgi:hypothetical protein